MLFVQNRNVIVFDIDDTLLLWDEKSRDLTADTKGRTVVICPYDNKPYSFIVHTRHVDFLKREKAKGSYVIAWSRSEGAWAKAAVEALGLESYVDLAISKPIKCVDDKNNLIDIVGAVLFLDKDGHSV
jgi:hydroxymethylpyrimidine pyrophosphatase-like HAD family hydrolase